MVATLLRAWSAGSHSAQAKSEPANWLVLLILLPLLVGCDGCRWDPSSEQEENQQLQQKLPPLTSRAAKAYPATRSDAGHSGSPDGAVKPGHWTSAELTLRSNREDRRGIVQTRAEVIQSPSVFADEAPVETPLPDSAQSMRVRRPANLPKGQKRRLDTRLLVPDRGSRIIESVGFQGEFLSDDSAERFDLQPARFAGMLPQTYFFVILTDRPERFIRLQTADWASVYRDDLSFAKQRDNYRIIIPPTQGILPIAETALDWTSTAVLLWDDVPTGALTPNQRTAILDWLHFGGLLIVNGPAGVDSLSERAFRDLLPIQPGGVDELPIASAEQFVQANSVATDRSVSTVNAELEKGLSQVASAGQKRADAEEIDPSGLLLERRVGRGRIVQCRVDLMSDWLLKWQSYDSFFNSAVLARPPRVFRRIHANDLTEQMNPIALSPDTGEEPTVDGETLPPLRQTFVGVDVETVAPAINTGLRFFSRDGRMPAVSTVDQSSNESTPARQRDNQDAVAPIAPEPLVTEPLTAGRSSDLWTHPVSGLGGWKNNSPMLTWSREVLRREIGVTIPDSALVFRSLLIYLIVLIPINYFVFRLLGRLEWAWLAIVPLAILGAMWVARAAQLDVGLARSRNEIAMLELPKGYSRGHLTRVIGLYNSLASQYRVSFDSPDAAIQVIRTENTADQREANLFGTIEPELLFGFEAGPSLENIAVGSNSYGVVHAEQIFNVEGTIELQSPASVDSTEEDRFDQAQVWNRSSLELLDAFVIERDEEGQVRVASLGTLASGSRKPIRFRETQRVRIPSGLPMGMTDGMQRLLAAENITPGSARLVARLEQPLGGITLSPDCQQVRGQTLALVHLAYPRRDAAAPDKNLITDFTEQVSKLDSPEHPGTPRLAGNTSVFRDSL